MTGAALMRDAAVLAAECAMAVPADQVASVETGWTAHPQRRAELGARLAAMEADPAGVWAHLAGALGLGRESAWLVLLCAAVELYPEAAAAVSILAEEPRVALPTPGVMARVLRAFLGLDYATTLAALLEGGAALRAGVVEVLEPVAGQPRSARAIRLQADALQALLRGGATLGTRRPLGSSVAPLPCAPAFDVAMVAGAGALLTRRGALCLRARSRRAGRQLACDLASHLGQTALLLTVGAEGPATPELLPHGDGLLVLDLGAGLSGRPLPLSWAQSLATARPVVLIVPAGADTGELATVDVPSIGVAEARRIWASFLPAPEAEAMSVRFRVTREEVEGAVHEARDLLEVEGGTGGPGPERIAERLRARGARGMGRHVTVLEPREGLDRLVVPRPLRDRLQEIVAWHRTSHRVYGEIGMTLAANAGQGLTCLFGGKPGTGKTLAACCLAADLGLNVYRIDLAQVVSKYIGETEKALSTIFDEAEAGHGLLLFDEADALFGKRSEVKDAHDRYANIEVSYLLQRMESFEGIAVLTTNFQGNLDAAFVRRLRFSLEFPMPDRVLRRDLWDRSLPRPEWRAPDLDLDAFAARFTLSGGNIHNIGLAATHLAAGTPTGKVTNVHLVRATLRELEKTGRPVTPSAFGSLAQLLPEARE